MKGSEQMFSQITRYIDPERLSAIQAEFMQKSLALLEQAKQGKLPVPANRRFAHAAWQAQPAALLQAHIWELSAQVLQQYAQELDLDHQEREKLSFALMQWLEAMSPTNFLCSNPQAWDTLLNTQGQSLIQGAQNFLHDLQKGRMTQTDESQFALGENLATTQGAVIYQNELIQLIQYRPRTQSQHAVPLLIVPPCINKYYILDLQPENSLVRYVLDQGIAVFLISWRNPVGKAAQQIQAATWGDYLEHGVLQAIDVVQAVSQTKRINTLGFCIGGTLLSCALALAKAQGQTPAASMTLLTTMLDFADVGVLNVFIDELNTQLREWQMAQGGLLHASELATTFSFLRPAELVWNYVSSNYLEGKTPTAFDLLYWNADGTHLPGPFFAWYLRHTYLENRLVQNDGVTVDGYQLNLACLDLPVYLYASRDDHIVPWRSAYASVRALQQAEHRFVLGASGHIAGVINPPQKKRRHYWKADQVSAQLSAEQWLEQAERVEGSWWPDWITWLLPLSGEQVPSPQALGNSQYPELEQAPGSYVKERVI